MFEDLKQVLVDEFRIDAEKITMEAQLSADLGINSLDSAELLFQCEQKFNIEIDDEELHNFNTVGDIVRYLESKA